MQNQQKTYQKNRKIKQGKWTAAEKLRFLDLVQKYGRNWIKIQQKFKTRSVLQIRSHAQKVFLKMSKQDIDAYIGTEDEPKKTWKKMIKKIPKRGSKKTSERTDTCPDGKRMQRDRKGKQREEITPKQETFYEDQKQGGKSYPKIESTKELTMFHKQGHEIKNEQVYQGFMEYMNFQTMKSQAQNNSSFKFDDYKLSE